MAFDWKSLVSAVAPVIGTAVGGPLGGMAVKAVGDALGLSEATEDTIAKALTGASAEQLAALKAADQAFAAKMKELDIDLAKIDANDRASARQMATIDHVTPRVLAVVIVSGFFGLLGYMLVYGLSRNVAGSEAFILLLGALSAAFGSVMQFYFGSSASSRVKDEALSKRG